MTSNVCCKIDLPFDIEFDFEPFIQTGMIQNKAHVDDLPINLLNYFRQRGLTVNWLEVFVLRPGVNHVIHTDGPEIDNKAKFNYVVGGTDSLMRWFESDPTTVRPHTTRTGNSCLLAKGTPKLIHQERVEGVNVVKVGILHDVINPTDLRLCLSIALDGEYGRLSYEELVDIIG